MGKWTVRIQLVEPGGTVSREEELVYKGEDTAEMAAEAAFDAAAAKEDDDIRQEV